MLTLLTAVLAPLLPVSAPVPTALARADTTLEERLDAIVLRLDEQRVANHIPGMALAIVKDDAVILARGFGVADLETGRPVEADTLFAIGSCTKAFTATLAGMLVDDGLLAFDDPVTKYLPEFQLPVRGADADSVVTLRDLMSHRTGFTRMTALWAGGGASREEILRTAVKAEPWADFRSEFLYNNVMFLAAGMAEARAAEEPWDDLIQARIFTPLGMGSSSLSVAAAQKDKRLALGYEWDASGGVYKHKPMRELAQIAPAGAINSNVLDMSEWLRLLLAGGEHEGQRLIQEETLHETWSANIAMGPDGAYGLGWMLHDDNGLQVVEHGGNIDGFSAEVALLPDKGVGFVLLANVTATPLMQGSIEIIFEGLMSQSEEAPAPATSEDDSPESFEDYLGKYQADFGSFDDATFEVLVQNEHLAVDVPGQMIYELESPDATGKWSFRLTRAIAVDFVRDDQGQVVGMNMYQNGMAFDLPREGYEPTPEIPLAQLARFLGVYHDPALDEDVTVLIHRGRLAIDIPSQMTYDLRPPDAEGKRHFWITDDLAARFHEDQAGAITGFTLFERGTEREAPRVGEALQGKGATPGELRAALDELLDAHPTRGLGQLLTEHGTLRSTSHVRLAQAGLEGSFVLEARLDPPASRITMDFGVFGRTDIGVLEGRAWVDQSATGYAVQTGARLSQLLHSLPSVLLGDWRQHFDAVHALRFEELDGKRALVVELQNSDWPAWTLYVDPTTGDLLRMDNVFTEGPIELPMSTTLSDYALVEGARVAHTSIEQSTFTGRTIQTVSQVEVGIELAPDFAEYQGEPK